MKRRTYAARKATPLDMIELLVLDVDGVLTDGRLYFSARGEALKAFHVRDGHGIKLLMQSGVAVAAVSGRRSAAVTARMRELGCATWCRAAPTRSRRCSRSPSASISHPSACACLVDDTPDLPLMAAVGFAAAVADAHPLVLVGRALDEHGARRTRRGARTVRCAAARTGTLGPRTYQMAVSEFSP